MIAIYLQRITAIFKILIFNKSNGLNITISSVVLDRFFALKRFIIAIVTFLLFFAPQSFAQVNTTVEEESVSFKAPKTTKPDKRAYYRNEISLSYGLGDPFFSQWFYSGSIHSNIGSFTLNFSHRINKTILLGADFTYYSAEYYSYHYYQRTYPNMWGIAATARFNWFRTRSDIFGMYSKVGLGIMGGMVPEGENTDRLLVFPSGQLSLVGFDIGRRFGGFLELGAGYQGYVHAGIRLKF